jgi:hypothetical protein
MKLKAKNSKLKANCKGQVMLITVLALSGMLIGATTIAGLLMTYQIRNSSDITNSTKAIMTADAGIECGLYEANISDSQNPRTNYCFDNLKFTNGASTTIEKTGSLENRLIIRSVGNSSRIYRALEMEMTLTEEK